jgi:hypothetical protein
VSRRDSRRGLQPPACLPERTFENPQLGRAALLEEASPAAGYCLLFSVGNPSGFGGGTPVAPVATGEALDTASGGGYTCLQAFACSGRGTATIEDGMARWRLHTSGPLTPIPGLTRGEAGGIVSSVMMMPFNRPLLAGLGGQTPKGWSSDTSLLPPDGGERPPTRAALTASVRARGGRFVSVGHGQREAYQQRIYRPAASSQRRHPSGFSLARAPVTP